MKGLCAEIIVALTVSACSPPPAIEKTLITAAAIPAERGGWGSVSLLLAYSESVSS